MNKRKHGVFLAASVAALMTLSCLTGGSSPRPVYSAPLDGTIWLYADGQHIRYQKFFAGGALFLIDENSVNNNWRQRDSKVTFSINNGQTVYEGEFLDANTIKGTARSDIGTTWEFGLTRSVDPARAARFAHRETWERASPFPQFTGPLIGRNEVRIRNPNAFDVIAAIRSGHHGIDLNVSALGYNTVFIPDDDYEIYFTFSGDPNSLYQGDDFTLAGYGFEIDIVPAADGNYGIRRVN